MVVSRERVFGLAAVVASLLASGCPGQHPLSCPPDAPSDVASIELVTPDRIPAGIDPGPSPETNLGLIAIEFNVDIDPTSLDTQSVHIAVRGGQGHQSDPVPGSFHYDAATRTVYFIASGDPAGIGFSPGPGENLRYYFMLEAMPEHGCVRRANGDCIDGCDDDTLPGGQSDTRDAHTWDIEVVG